MTLQKFLAYVVGGAAVMMCAGLLFLTCIAVGDAKADDPSVRFDASNVYYTSWTGCWTEVPDPHPDIERIACGGDETLCMFTYRAYDADGNTVGSNIWWSCSADVVIEEYPDGWDGNEDGQWSISIFFTLGSFGGSTGDDPRWADALSGAINTTETKDQR
jgi:hypothetical protein